MNSVEPFSAALQTTNHKIASDEQNCCAIDYYHTIQVEYCHVKINIQRIGVKHVLTDNNNHVAIHVFAIYLNAEKNSKIHFAAADQH